jgi:hypothetical protein
LNQLFKVGLTTMRLSKLCEFLPAYSLCALLVCLSPALFSATGVLADDINVALSGSQSGYLLLAQAQAADAEDEKPRSGTLVLPAAAEEEKSEKKCMTVCQRWGQECMIDATRGVRKCRRACKEFGQECF